VLDSGIQKLARLVTDGASSMIGRKSGVSWVIIKDVKNKIHFDLVLRRCLKHEELCL
jgi:hypothetical protein